MGRKHVELDEADGEDRESARCCSLRPTPLLGSCILNFVFCLVVLAVFSGQTHLLGHDGSRQYCNNHGMAYGDDPEAPECSCFDCWTGPYCETRIPDDSAECILQAGSGTPYVFEDFWVEHSGPMLEVLPSYHIGYGSDMPRLTRAIRELHTLTGNAVVDDSKEIIIGIGSTELISAALYALAPQPEDEQPGASAGDAGGAKAVVWSRPPYYNGYDYPGQFYHSETFEYGTGSAHPLPPNATAAHPVIELVTSPNNPDGHLRTAAVPKGPNAKYIQDLAYYWPHFTAIGAPANYGNDTVTLFTLSKLTGHASTRIGWAIVSDPNVAQRMRRFVKIATFGVPRENQLRAIHILEHLTKPSEGQHLNQLLTYARGHMLSRWTRLEELMAQFPNAPFKLEPRDAPTADSYSGQVSYPPSPAYLWLELLIPNDLSAYPLPFNGSASVAIESVGIKGRPGTGYGETDERHARIELLMRAQDFEILYAKLKLLFQAASVE